MSRNAVGVAVVLALPALEPTLAADTTTYKYDARGRLQEMSVAGGVANGVKDTFSYDAATNIQTRQTVGPLNPRPVGINGSTSAALTGTTATLNVSLSGASPGGIVTFYVDGLYVGTATITNGRATIRLSGYAPGTYSVTVRYAGDVANDPATLTYNVKVQDLAWLPPVLELLLSE